MGTKILSGLQAGLPLAGLFVLYFLVRGKAFLALMKGTDNSFASMADKHVYVMFLGAFAFGALFLGAISGLIYSFVGVSTTFRFLALALAVLMSILAVATRTPMPVDKVIMNIAAAGVLGYLIPLFNAA